MRVPRTTIGGTMWVSFVVCLSLAALRNASATWAGAVFLVTAGALLCATVAAICQPAAERPWWLGFALFGWGYLWLVFRASGNLILPGLPTSTILTAIAPLFRTRALWPKGRLDYPMMQVPFWQIGHCLWALVLASLGGLAALTLCRCFRSRVEAPIADPEAPRTVPPQWWRRPAAIAFGGSALFVMVALVAYPRHHALLVGTAYLLTISLVGTSLLGALLGGPARRTEWLGAALFGSCFLAFQLTTVSPNEETRPPFVAANRLLGAVRPWFVAGVRMWHGTAFANETRDARIRQKLEEPIAMEFGQETALEDVLLYIRAATEGPNGDTIPIYVDPAGLEEAEETMRSPVQLHLVGVPLRVTLALLLEQLGMRYTVRDGLLLITSETWVGFDQEELDDPYLLIGYCVLTSVAAGFGSLLAVRVARVR